MKILVLSGSPKGEDSVTLQYMYYLQKYYKEDSFDIAIVGDGKYTDDLTDRIKNADLIIYTSSIFHFSVHQQTLVFLDSLEKHKDILKDKPFTYFTTSVMIMEFTAHTVMKSAIERFGARYIRSLSLFDDALFKLEGQTDLVNWFRYVKSVVNNTVDFDFKDRHFSIIMLDATDGSNDKLNNAMTEIAKHYRALGIEEIKTVELRNYNILPCISCGACYTELKCFHKDDFLKVIDEVYASADIIFTVSEQKYGQLSPVYKAWLDRHVQYGRHAYPHGFILDRIAEEKRGAYQSRWTMHGHIIDSKDNCPHIDSIYYDIHSNSYMNFLSDAYIGYYDVSENGFNRYQSSLKNYLENFDRALDSELRPTIDFYKEGIWDRFRRVAWNIQKNTPKDYEHYKREGAYELPTYETHVGPVHSIKESIEQRHHRLIPFKMTIASLDEEKPFLIKRKITLDMFMKEFEEKMGRNESKPKKTGLFSRFTK